jgi:putative protease
MKKQLKIPELLAPAGSFEKLQTVIHYGADAVYMGGKQFSLRAHATNFGDEDMQKGVEYAHARNVKVYVTVNIFAHNDDLGTIETYLQHLQKIKVDGLIISDPGILTLAKKHAPEIPIHLSTQANVTNRANAQFWLDQGAKRLNLARELSLQEIKEIRNAVEGEIEVFVHGALCISYSGRCMLSQYLTGRSANRGDCAHPCRYSYQLEEEKRPGQFFPVEEDSRGTYIFNAKDLCLLSRLPELVGAGVDSIKIEGRMKSVYYAGVTVRLYRAALDYIGEQVEAGAEPSAIQLPKKYRDELNTVGTRSYTENFFDSPPDSNDMLYESPRVLPVYEPIGIVRALTPRLLIEARNPINTGDSFNYMDQGLTNKPYVITGILNEKTGAAVNRANPGDLVTLETGHPITDWEEHALLRRKVYLQTS